MENRLFRNAVTLALTIAMVTTAFFIPTLSDTGNVYAADNKQTSERSVLYDITPMLNVPTQIQAGKSFSITITGDSLTTPAPVGVRTAYIADEFTLTKNGVVQKESKKLNGATSTVIPNIVLTEKGTSYKFHVSYKIFTYNSTKQEWTEESIQSSNSVIPLVYGKIKVTFNKNKGKFKKGSIKSKTVMPYGKYGRLGKLKKRSGYKFMGWYTAKIGGKKITSKSNVVFLQNTTLYAQWKYTIKLNANKGKVSKKSKKITSGKKYGKLPTPKRKGYTFKGWYTKKKGGSKITAASYVAKAKKHTLYAQWTKKSSSAANSPYVTKSEYGKITKGMTYTQVCDIIGGKGNFLMRVNGNPVYHWYTDSSEEKFVAVNFYESSVTGTLTVNSKNNNCGW